MYTHGQISVSTIWGVQCDMVQHGGFSLGGGVNITRDILADMPLITWTKYEECNVRRCMTGGLIGGVYDKT